jgi:hypothetical protein
MSTDLKHLVDDQRREAAVEEAWIIANGAPFSSGFKRVAKFLAIVSHQPWPDSLTLPDAPPKLPSSRTSLTGLVRTEPPRVAELLVSWCINKPYREALLYDFDEDFQRDLSKGMTVARARLRYWGGALNSITPQLLAAAKRIGIFGLFTDYARRLW